MKFLKKFLAFTMVAAMIFMTNDEISLVKAGSLESPISGIEDNLSISAPAKPVVDWNGTVATVSNVEVDATYEFQLKYADTSNIFIV